MSNFWKDRKVYVSITTISDGWKQKIDDINKLGLEEVTLFLTGLEYNKIPKDYFFSLIDKSCIKSIPFTHINSNTSPKDIEFLKRRFNTKVFNFHSERDFKLKHDLSKYRKDIYIETLFAYALDKKELDRFAGICIDLSHMEIAKKQNPEVFKKNSELIEKYPCGCNHISAYKENAIEEAERIMESSHYFTDLSQFNYLLNYPSYYYSNILALEIENSIEDQLKAKKYIISLLKDK